MSDTNMVEMNGCRFAVAVAGEGVPPVVFVSALGEDQSEWDDVRTELHVPTTQVTYGRPGLGDSDGLPPDVAAVPRRFGWAADQLHDLLDAAGVASPRVLVGHSVGGLIVERYAVYAPDDTAGLVFVDTTDPRLFLGKARDERLMLDGDDGDGGIVFDFVSSWNEYIDSPPEPGPHAVVVSSAPGRWSRCKEPERYAPFTLREIDEAWQDFQRQLARRKGAELVVAHFAGHRLDSEAPGLVACVIDTVVTAVREQTKPLFDVERLYNAGGRLVQPGTVGSPVAEVNARGGVGTSRPVVAAIVTSRHGVLVGRRVDGRPPWTFVSGEVEMGESPTDAAVREVREETGLLVEASERELGRRVHPETGRTMIYVACHVVGETGASVGDDAGLSDVRWVGLREAGELLVGLHPPVHAYLVDELD